MKYILFMGIFFLLMSCNTKYNIIDTGLANGKFAGNMYEYLQSSSYDWDSTRLMIERADLVDLFEGKREGFEQITFFGPTNHSIRRYMLREGITSIAEMDQKFCYEMIMRCVVKGKHMRDDIPRGKNTANEYDENQGTGGTVFTGAMGNRFWIYSFQESYNDVAGVGAVVLYIKSLETGGTMIDVASTDIEPTNGVVHSLHYNFTLGEL
ncbi:fasciclin domain-containing protein [Butyricimonas synergistica]|uniref:fasciclin domain-containing protein n=1 Tax=Butyricimonas synergistica TaxID=544644 RepID=UPI0003A86309|nr:fasciclin domain-containing protein [Butyricimonas synergistica]